MQLWPRTEDELGGQVELTYLAFDFSSLHIWLIFDLGLEIAIGGNVNEGLWGEMDEVFEFGFNRWLGS